MFIIVFAVIDLILGVVLAASPYFDFTGNGIIFWLAVIGILKGLYSIIAALVGGFMYDVIGWFDLAGGILLWLTTMGLIHPAFLYIGIAILLKGIYSLMIGLISQN
jgi:hypothetical protein